MASNAQTKLEALTKRKEKIANQIRQIQSKEGADKRKLDTRRKILLGAILEKLIVSQRVEINDVNKWFETYLTKERDKELFDGYLESLSLKKEELN